MGAIDNFRVEWYLYLVSESDWFRGGQFTMTHVLLYVSFQIAGLDRTLKICRYMHVKVPVQADNKSSGVDVVLKAML